MVVLSVPLVSFCAPLTHCSIVMVLLLIWSLQYCSIVVAFAAAVAARRLLLRARLDGGQTMRGP